MYCEKERGFPILFFVTEEITTSAVKVARVVNIKLFLWTDFILI